MRPSLVLVVALLLASLVACAAENSDDGSIRANNARNPNPTATGIAPNADVGMTPHDMPSGGRGSLGSHGKGP